VPGSGEVVRKLLSAALEKALRGQVPVARAYVARNSDRYTPTELLAEAERKFVVAVTTLGAAAGAAAAAPGVGTVAGAAANVAEVGAFVEANVFFVMVVAEVHGVLPDDPDRIRALVLATLLGDASELITKGAARLGKHFGPEVAKGVPTDAIARANQVLGHRFLKRWGTRQGALLLGRELPVLIGAAVGGAGNRLVARKTVQLVADAFGPPPRRW
jgi:hypothetical protein